MFLTRSRLLEDIANPKYASVKTFETFQFVVLPCSAFSFLVGMLEIPAEPSLVLYVVQVCQKLILLAYDARNHSSQDQGKAGEVADN